MGLFGERRAGPRRLADCCAHHEDRASFERHWRRAHANEPLPTRAEE